MTAAEALRPFPYPGIAVGDFRRSYTAATRKEGAGFLGIVRVKTTACTENDERRFSHSVEWETVAKLSGHPSRHRAMRWAKERALEFQAAEDARLNRLPLEVL